MLRMSKDSYFGDLSKVDEQDMVELNDFVRELNEVSKFFWFKIISNF